MTTPKAAAQYLDTHLRQWGGLDCAVYNPHDKPLYELPVIYGFHNGGSNEWLYAQLLAEDGTALGSHICSHERYMPHDLGVTEGSRPDRHEYFRAHYPDGYRMEFIPLADVEGHAGLEAAYQRNQAQRDAAEKGEA